MKIEISGPDDQGQYTVEVESDQAETQEEGMPPPQGGEEAEAPGAGTQVCKSVEEVCAVVESVLGGGKDPKAMWDEEAASRASAQKQQQPY